MYYGVTLSLAILSFRVWMASLVTRGLSLSPGLKAEEMWTTSGSSTKRVRLFFKEYTQRKNIKKTMWAKCVSLWFNLTGTAEEMKTTDEWLVANINMTGFYRVNYDSDNWDRLLATLNANHGVGNPKSDYATSKSNVFSSSAINCFPSSGDSSDQPSSNYWRCL